MMIEFTFPFSDPKTAKLLSKKGVIRKAYVKHSYFRTGVYRPKWASFYNQHLYAVRKWEIFHKKNLPDSAFIRTHLWPE